MVDFGVGDTPQMSPKGIPMGPVLGFKGIPLGTFVVCPLSQISGKMELLPEYWSHLKSGPTIGQLGSRCVFLAYLHPGTIPGLVCGSGAVRVTDP